MSRQKRKKTIILKMFRLMHEDKFLTVSIGTTARGLLVARNQFVCNAFYFKYSFSPLLFCQRAEHVFSLTFFWALEQETTLFYLLWHFALLLQLYFILWASKGKVCCILLYLSHYSLLSFLCTENKLPVCMSLGFASLTRVDVAPPGPTPLQFTLIQ